MLNGSTDLEKLNDLSTYTYKNQAIWMLNSSFSEIENDAEKIWGFVKKFSQLDLDKKEQGSGLDEMNAHRFLESIGETLTVQELRNNLRSTGALGQAQRPKTVPLIQYLLYKYSKTIDWKYVVNASQGDNKAELEEAQRLLDQVNALFEEARAKADAAATALKQAETQEADAKTKEADALSAQRELETALAELKSQEDAFNNKTNSLKSKSEDEGVSVVNRNKAKNELAQHLASDPLPLRKAKISQEAAVKKSEKASAAAQGARKNAEASRKAAADAKAASDQAVADAQAKVKEAEDYLNVVKRKPGVAQGAIWWLQRELDESKNYVPEKKGGVRKVDTHK